MLEKALKALADKDYKAFAACFSEDGRYFDYCPACNGKDNYFVYGSAAMPTVYKERRMMEASEVGPALAMLALPEMKGVSGAVLCCDGGTSSFLHPERFY